MARQLFSLAAAAVVSFASTVPPAPPTKPPKPVVTAHPAPAADGDKKDLSTLAKTDPIALLAECRARYKDKVQGYKATLVKRERVHGTLYDEETVKMVVRDEPYSVLLLWQSGAREVKLGGLSLGKIEGVLYVAGENKGDMLAWRPDAAFLSVIRINPTSDQAKAASRYCIAEGGLMHALARTHKAWSDSKDRGQLKWDYLGTKPVEKTGNRVCHLVRRSCDPAELDPFLMNDPKPDAKTRPADAFKTVTIMIDAETGMQIGSRLERDGELIGEYYFRDIALNPTHAKDQFKQSALKK